MNKMNERKIRYRTEQENFWAGEFGDAYIERCQDLPSLVPPRIHRFSQILGHCPARVESFLEFGPNVGLNLIALHQLVPQARLMALEINAKALDALEALGFVEVREGSLLESRSEGVADFVFTAGVLIHIKPEELPRAYDALYAASRRYLCIAEYFNPVPVEVEYRGHAERLYKRDFAGELMDRFSDLRLLGYGFGYSRDPNFPLGDSTWFLLEKTRGSG
jgi:spore coat polysaccharide biosynthesis protein SpsF